MSARLLKVIGLACILLFLVVPALSEEQDKGLPTVPVEVTNFPDPQNISGTVDVGNFPIDEDGNLLVKVVDQDAFSKTVIVNEDLELIPGVYVVSNIVETEFYKEISYHIQTSLDLMHSDPTEIQFRNYADENFLSGWTSGKESTNFFYRSLPTIISCPILGKESRLRLRVVSYEPGGNVKITAYLTK